MTTFKEYLLEETKVDFSDFKRNASTMLSKSIFLFRGTGTPRHTIELGDFTGTIQDARTIERSAKGSKAMARLAAGWEIPNRKLAYFVTRDAKHASMFGDLLLVIPADNVKLFAWTASDFNQSQGTDYKRQFGMVESAIKALVYGTYYLEPDEDGAFSPSTQIVLKCLDDAGLDPKTARKEMVVEDPKTVKFVDALLAKEDEIGEFNDYVARSVTNEIEKIRRALEVLKMKSVGEVFAGANPKSFKIKLFKDLGSIPRKLKSADEVWFNGKYLAFNLDSRHTAERDAEQILKLILEVKEE